MDNKKFPRDRQAAWDARNLRTVSTHLTREQAAALRRTCRRRGTTQYRLLQEMLLAYIERERCRDAAVHELARRGRL